MPVTTLSDLKEQRSVIAENIAWAKREQRVAATEYERERAAKRLPELTAAYAFVCEEIRQGENQRKASWGLVWKSALTVIFLALFIGLLV